MPVSISHDPFNNSPASGKPETGVVSLRVPQARVLQALMPEKDSDPPFEWPLLNRAYLGVRAGYTAVSGSITRALNGIRKGSSSGPPQTGLLALKYVEEVPIDVNGVIELNYRITSAGIAAYRDYVKVNGGLPEVKDASTHTNKNRGYEGGKYRQGEKRYR